MAMTERHTSRVRSELMTDGIGSGARDGFGSVRFRYSKAWLAECSCGWTAGSGVGVRTYRTRDGARSAWREHKEVPPVPREPDGDYAPDTERIKPMCRTSTSRAGDMRGENPDPNGYVGPQEVDETERANP